MGLIKCLGACPGDLYCRAAIDGGNERWQAEMMRDGEVERWHGASELRARAWLAVLDKPRFALRVFGRESPRETLCAAGAVRGG